MNDTKSCTEKSNNSQKTTKLAIGHIGFYKGKFAEIKTTRCFFFHKTENKNIRGVELWIDVSADERLDFMLSSRAWRNEVDKDATYVFVPIVDFRKYFVYDGAAHLIYGKS